MQHMLIVANSGRALAQCAARSGFSSVVLDCFADVDTHDASRVANAVSDASGIHLDGAALLDTARRLCPPGETDALIYGSGLEAMPELIDELARFYPVCGNPGELIRRLKHPDGLLPLLDAAGFAYPETCWEHPLPPDGWLVKRIGGCGGLHVRKASEHHATPDLDYYQRAIKGQVHSVLFLADRRAAHVIGISEALPALAGAPAPFTYSGAISHAQVSPRTRAELAWKLNALVEATGLVGLNGMDFIVDDGEILVLEINPRPTATLELYDPDVAGGLLRAHVAACRDEPFELETEPGPLRGQAIVFAHSGLRVPDHGIRTQWCADIPYPGSVFAAGMPVCSVRAEGYSREEVVASIDRYRAAVLDFCEVLQA